MDYAYTGAFVRADLANHLYEKGYTSDFSNPFKIGGLIFDDLVGKDVMTARVSVNSPGLLF